MSRILTLCTFYNVQAKAKKQTYQVWAVLVMSLGHFIHTLGCFGHRYRLFGHVKNYGPFWSGPFWYRPI